MVKQNQLKLAGFLIYLILMGRASASKLLSDPANVDNPDLLQRKTRIDDPCAEGSLLLVSVGEVPRAGHPKNELS